MKKLLYTFMILFPLFLAAASTPADMGPKATMNFKFVWQVQPAPTITSGLLLQCEDETCTQSQPLMRGGPQHFACSPDACESMAYGYTEFNRLQLEFSDGKTRLSNIFTKKWFAAQYLVTVRENDLVVEEQRGEGNSLIPLFVLWYLLAFVVYATPVIALLGCTTLLIVGIVVIVRRRKRKPPAAPYTE